MINVVTVLRSGGEFTPAHVAAIRDQVAHHLDAAAHCFLCLTDQVAAVEKLGVMAIGLEHDWPGWWSKIELFNLRHPRPFWLYLDLDSIAVGNLGPLRRIAERGRFTMLSDFYRRGDAASGLMCWRETDLRAIHARFREDPARWMAEFAEGDQGFIKDCILRGFVPQPDRWQEELRGEVVSYKADLAGDLDGQRRVSIPPAARLICFHGRPRPWNSDLACLYWNPAHPMTRAA